MLSPNYGPQTTEILGGDLSPPIQNKLDQRPYETRLGYYDVAGTHRRTEQVLL